MGDLTTDVQALQDAANTVVAAVETVVTDVADSGTTAPSVGDDLLSDVVAFLEGKGYTVTAPAAPAA